MSNVSSTEGPRGGGRQFVFLVLVLFGLILAVVIALALFGGDGGLLAFDYEGA